MPDRSSPFTNRRERPAKAALTRRRIIAVASEILRTEGLEKVSMRRVAAALDTGPASLYVYVRDTADLHAQILDALLAPVTRMKPRGDWRQRIKAFLTRYMQVLFTHPEIARMALATMPSGPHYLTLVDKVLGLLVEGGIPDLEAAWAVDLLLLYATASVAEHIAWKHAGLASSGIVELEAAVNNADPNRYPHVARLRKQLMSGQSERLAWHLDSMINGALHTRATGRSMQGWRPKGSRP